MQSKDASRLTAAIGVNIPSLRRYGRALTGSQTSGDRFATATLEALLEGLSAMAVTQDPKVGLFHAFHLVWASAGAPLGTPDSAMSARAQVHMARLTPHAREALLLNVIEGFSHNQIGTIMQLDRAEAARVAVSDAGVRLADGFRAAADAMPDDLPARSPALVALAALMLAVVCLRAALRRLSARNLAPRRTIAALRKNGETLVNMVKSDA